MFSVIGFIVVWVIATIIMAMVINTIRAKSGTNLNDPITAFLKGFSLGPIGVLAGLNPRSLATGEGTPLIMGGVIGTIVAYNVYQAI